MKAWLGRVRDFITWPFSSTEKRLQIVMDYASRDVRVKDLLEQARADGVRFSLLPCLGGNSLGYYLQDPEKKEQSIYLGMTSSLFEIFPRPIKNIAGTLAHELRHYWQYKQLGLTADTVMASVKDPHLAFIFNRVAEADAFSFQESFMRGMTPFARKDTPAADKAVMRAAFHRLLSSTTLSSGYDVEQVQYLKVVHLADNRAEIFAKANEVQLDITMIQNLVAGYTKPLPAPDFEAMVLDQSSREVIATVDLLDAFNKAAVRQDKNQLAYLRPQIETRVDRLSKNDLRWF